MSRQYPPRPTPAYNGGDGDQLREMFRAINDSLGSEVVTNIHKITNTRRNHPYRASGRQLRTAFEQINTHAGSELVDLSTIQNIADGRQISAAFQIIQDELLSGPPPFETTHVLTVGYLYDDAHGYENHWGGNLAPLLFDGRDIDVFLIDLSGWNYADGVANSLCIRNIIGTAFPGGSEIICTLESGETATAVHNSSGVYVVQSQEIADVFAAAVGENINIQLTLG